MVTLKIIQSLSLFYILTKWDTITIVTRYFLEFWKKNAINYAEKKQTSFLIIRYDIFFPSWKS